MNKKKKITTYTIIIAVLTIGLILWLSIMGFPLNLSTLLKDKTTVGAKSHTGVRTTKVQVIYTNETIDVSGHIEPYETEDLAFKIGGEIVYLPFSEGTRIKKGTLVARLDDTEQRYQLAQIDYNIEQTKLSGESRKLELLKLQRQIYLKELAETKLYAGISGIIACVDKSINDTVKAGERVLRIINTNKMRSTVEVDELDAPKLKVGQKVIFHFDALPNIEAIGRVASIPIESTITSEGIAVVDAQLTLDNPPRGVMPNYSFNAEIVIKAKKKLLLLDKRALINRNGKKFVIIMRKPRGEEIGKEAPPVGKSPLKEVVTKEYDGERVQILSGLKGGEEIIIPTPELLKKNSKSVNPLSIFGIKTPRFRRRPRP